MKTVIIVGSAGQDGQILATKLKQDGVAVLGISRQGIDYGPGNSPFPIDSVNIQEPSQVNHLVKIAQPYAIYYLAAYHHSAEDTRPQPAELYAQSHQVNVQGLVHFLEAIRQFCPEARLFYAASSHVFGHPDVSPQDESTPLNPQCIYGITKVTGIHCCRFYRAEFHIHASVGILYNHESQYRKPSFLASKVISAAVRISRGSKEKLVLGDLSALVDWGYAPDYVEAMVGIVDLPTGDDFVIASGRTYPVRQFVEIAFAQLGLDWKAHVTENPSLIRHRRPTLSGNSAKLARVTGWKAKKNLEDIVQLLIYAHGAGA